MTELFNNLFIFEMANNHQGMLDHGLRIIDEVGKIVRRHGIRGGVKFQYRHLDSMIHPEVRMRRDAPHVSRFLDTRLEERDFLQLASAVREQAMVTICTPFDEYSVGLLLDHGIQIIKVASCSANDWPLLEAIAKTRKPVICSTGGKSIYEIDNIVSFFSHRRVDLALMHCIALYPVTNEDAQLGFIDRMRRRYPYVPIGYSGHEEPENLDIAKVAAAKGTTIFERHVGVETDNVKLNKYSMNPQQAEAWVSSIVCVRRICSHDAQEKKISQREVESLLPLTRGTYANRPIKKGEVILRDMVFFAMPCREGQTTSGEYQETMVASRNYGLNDAIRERRRQDLINVMRGIIHDAKGMLYEANIEIGSDFTIELSHHYGMEHFRQTGALIFNIVNREYCKKIIVMLPGQSHPVHYHKIKEETFHLLWGDLEVELNGLPVLLRRGEKLLMQRGARHAFMSRNGAIFEEISTSHSVDDSYYDDPAINSKDPIMRKTIIDDW